MPIPIRVLLVEDSASDAGLIAGQLTNGGLDVAVERIEDATAMRAALADGPWDLIISAYRLPAFDAPAALALLQQSGHHTPFFVISDAIDGDPAVAMMNAGAHDYFLKSNLARLAAAAQRELLSTRARAERGQALQSLHDCEAQLALAIEATGMGIFDSCPGEGKTFYSDLFRSHLLIPPDVDHTIEGLIMAIHTDDRDRVRRAWETALLPGTEGHLAEEYRLAESVDGQPRWISAWGRVLKDTAGKPLRFLGAVRDISAQKRSEHELQFQLRLTACITEQSTDGILLIGQDGLTRFANREARRLFGYSLEELLSKRPHDLLHHTTPDGRPCLESECELAIRMAAGETLRDFETVLFRRGGKPLDISISCGPVEINGIVIGVVANYRDISEKQQAARALRESDARFHSLFDADIVGILVTNNNEVLEANDYFLKMLGYSKQEFFSQKRSWRDITAPEYLAAGKRAQAGLETTGVCPALEKEYLRRDGTRVPAMFTAMRLEGATGTRIVCFVIDQTERKNLEQQFRQSQKLESIGLLAGGIAHDFNNLLTVINGYSDMVRSAMPDGHPLRGPLDQIGGAAKRATGLTRQLLTFSRRIDNAPKHIRLDDLVADVESMLRQLIGETIEIVLSRRARGGVIHADPGLIEQVIVNLAVNARDAMPKGGKLYIETSRLTLEPGFAAQSFSAEPGDYIALTITDTGTGMTPEIQARLFEPFFTTKEPGKGTGLGLSTVYGIVRQSGGSIKVHSGPDLGTSVRVLFPALRQGSVPKRANATPAPPLRGTETVLVVEDERGVRNYVRDVLRANGYRALDAARGEDAIDEARNFNGEIHLLLADVVLPGMNGTDLIRSFAGIRPGVPVLRMSGYPERYGALQEDGIPLIQKPFSGEALLSRIRRILDAGPARPAGT